jgi:putative endonuclease
MARARGPSSWSASMSKTYFVYIMASDRNGTLYIGVTSDLFRRTWEHREGMVPGFTKTYGVKQLVYFESYADIGLAIARETRLKKWKRRWKIELIEKSNPAWNDLYHSLMG